MRNKVHNDKGMAERCELTATVTVGRTKVYPCVARRGPAWRWVYRAVGPDGRRFDNTSIVELRRRLRMVYGPATVVVEPWRTER